MVIAANNNYVVTSVMSVLVMYLTAIICQPTNLFINKNKAHVIPRKRQSMKSLHVEYGCNFKKAYRMSWKSFKKLHQLLCPRIAIEPRVCVPNGPIPSEICLAVALRYFAGGSMLDIMISHGILRTESYTSIWLIVDAINSLPEFDMEYPKTQEAQKQIARDFQSKSQCGFSNCTGCIDGILIWIEKPNPTFCKKAGVEAGKFLCGRKHKFGLNMQAVCDSRRDFIDVLIPNPASASNFLSYATLSL
jgi:hypothetical protein